MNTETLTAKLHAKADTDLRNKLDAAFKPWMDEANPHNNARPEIGQSKRLDNALKQIRLGATYVEPTQVPWIHDIATAHKEMLFAYLSPQWRDRYVAEFMKKVETIAEEIWEIQES